MSDREFRAVFETAAESRLWLFLSAAARLWPAAWADSSTARLVRRAALSIDEWNAVDRVRYGAVTVGWAALAHLGCLALFPAYVAPALPQAAIVAVALGAVVIAGRPEPFATAWTESRLNQIARPDQNKDT